MSSDDLHRAIGDQENQRRKQQDQSQRTCEAGCNYFPSMLAVDLGPGGKLGLILRFESLLAVPPGAATVEIVSNVRRADNGHGSPQNFAVKAKYSTNFLIFVPSR